MSKNKSVSELLVEVAEENQVRMILDLLNDCKDLDEAKAKVQALLDKEAEA
ncbi:MAG: protein phosphatase [Oscillospiraceae bacterium]|nr:protein phosphatase [Oscillospiraceae bacterium]